MEGKLIKDLATDIPEPKDLLVWWDKTEGDTNAATVEDVVLSGLPPITQAGTVLTARLDLQGQGSLEWSNGTTPPGGFLPTYGLANAGEILTVSVDGSGTEWAKAAGGGSSLPDGDATNSSLVWDTTASKWAPSRIVKEAQNIHGGTFGTICYQLGEHLTGHLAVGTPGQVLTVKDLGMGLKVPEWQTASALPAMTVAEAGKVLSVKADGTGAEWAAASGLPTIGSNDSGKILTVSPDGVSAIWEKAVGEINYDGTSTLANVLSFNSPALTQVRLFGMPNLVNAEIEAHLRIDDVSVNANPKLTSFSLSSKRVRNLSIQGNTLLNSVWMSFDDVDGGINITNNAALTSLSLTVNKSISGDVSLLNGKFDANTINSILKMLVDLNGIGGKFEYGAGRTVDLSGGTNAAPAGQGIIDAQTLIARGATVKVNGTAITTTKKLIQAPEFDTVADKGKVLAVKADGSGLEWVTK